MPEAGITGAEKLAVVGRRLKEAGNGSLRKEALGGIRTAVRKVIPDVRRGADVLPHAGGLSSEVAGQKFAVRTSLASGKVSLVGSGMKELTDIDRGRVRHKIFDRDQWVQQKVVSGFFSTPVKESEPSIRREIEHVMQSVANKIERPL